MSFVGSGGYAVPVAATLYRDRLQRRRGPGFFRFVQKERELLTLLVQIDDHHVSQTHLARRRQIGKRVHQEPFDRTDA